MKVRISAIAVVVALCLSAEAALADVVRLKNGKQFEGTVEERDGQVIIWLARGSVTVHKADVESIEKSPSPLEAYDEKAKAVKPEDVAGHLKLAKGLAVRMKKELEAVLAIEPDNEDARALLGHKKVDGKWQTADGAFSTPPVPPGASGLKIIPDGTYDGASRGCVDDVGVRVTVKGGKITAVRVTGAKESRPQTSLTDLPSLIVQKQTTSVDAITGATMTSLAIMRASQTALDSAAPITLADVPDGRYTGASKGLGQGPDMKGINVEVEVKNHRILAVKIISQSKQLKDQLAQEALVDIPALIVAQQSPSVQPLAGAEITSRAIMRAAQAALDSSVLRVLPLR